MTTSLKPLRTELSTNGANMNIIIADDHSLVRSGLQDLLDKLEFNACIFSATSAAEALGMLKDGTQFDLALLDLFMQDMDGFQFIRQFCNSAIGVPVIVMSASTNPAHVRKAIDIGVSGYIPKSVDQSVFVNAIERVLSGGVYIPPEELLGWRTHDGAVEINPGNSMSIEDVQALLTDRQIQILANIRRGLSNKHIAREFGVSENTVKTHVSAILKTLGLSNRTEAGIFAERIGIV